MLKAVPLRARLLSVDSLVMLGVVLMELLAAYPWLEWFGGLPFKPWASTPISLPAAVAIILFPALATRLTLRGNISLVTARAAILAPSLLVTLALVVSGAGLDFAFNDPAWPGRALQNLPAVLAGLALGAYLLWRGIWSAGGNLDSRSVQVRMMGGIGGLTGLSLLWLLPGDDADTAGRLGPYVIGFFATGLLTAGLASYAGVEWEQGDKSPRAGAGVRRWLLIIASSVATLVLLGWLLAGALSFDLAARLAAPLGTAGEWLLMALVYAVAYPIGFLLTGFAWLLELFRSWFGGPPPPQNLGPPPDIDKWLKESQARSDQSGPLPVFEVLKWLLLALAAAGVVYLIVRAFRRSFYPADSQEVSEDRESLWSWHDLGSGLRAPLAGLVSRRRKATETLRMWNEDEGLPPDPRAVYARLLEEGQRAGRPRQAAETPLEYAGALGSLAGEERPGLEDITTAYVSYRYGDEGMGREELGQLRVIWLRLRDQLRGEGRKQG
jgi:hypothetical protein